LFTVFCFGWFSHNNSSPLNVKTVDPLLVPHLPAP
jgi:hypothetical protein